jgi:hypothetical protein
MSHTACPPPLPARRSRNLALLIVGLTLVVCCVVGAGLFGCGWWLVSRMSPSNFSMDDYTCEQNLEEIALIKEEWVTAHDGKAGDVIPPADLAEILAEHGEKLVCPLDPKHSPQTSYEFGPIGTDPACKGKALHDQKHNEKKPK